MSRLSYKTLFIILLFLLIPIVFLIRINQKGNKVSATWWNDSWTYRQRVDITGVGSTDLTDFQVSIDIGTSALIAAGKMKTDCSDIRFTDGSGNILPYWIEENNPGCNQITDTKIWIKVPSLPSSGAPIYLYYGNPSATAVQNGNQVFDFFDDFSKNSLDPAKWLQKNGTNLTISGGTLSVSANTDPGKLIAISSPTDNNYIIKARFQAISGTSIDERIGVGIKTNISNGYGYNFVLRNFTTSNVAYFLNDSIAWGTTMPFVWTKNTYYTMEIYHDGTRVKGRVNDNIWNTQSWSGLSGYPSLNFGSFSGTTSTWDWVIVRKSASSTPTTTPAAEEARPLGISIGGTGNETPSGSLVAYYKFDEYFGNTVKNSGIGGTSYNVYFGVDDSSPSWTNSGCKNNSCIKFDPGRFIRRSINLPQDHSISLWLKPSTVSGTQQLLSFQNLHYVVNLQNDRVLYQTNNTTSYQYCYGKVGSIKANEMHHILISYDSESSIKKIYVNGNLDNICNQGSYVNGIKLFTIAGVNSTFNLSGTIDEVKIYDYALSADEVKQDYNQGSATVFGITNLTVGSTSNSALYCVPGSTDYCASPVAEWKFEEGIGTTAYDTSGNNNHGIFGAGSSAPTWTIGKVGKGVSFDGVSDYVNIGDIYTIGTGDFSVNSWVKGSNSSTQVVFGTAAVGGNNFWLGIASPSQAAFSVNGTTANGGIVADGKWHLITGTRSGGYIRVYLDSVLVGGPTLTANTITTQVHRVGCFGTSFCFTGYIDQVRIYNYARTPAQIAWDYNQGAPVGWWKFDECQGSIAHDSSGIGNTGAIIIGASGTQNTLGTCTVGTSAAWTAGASGKINGSLNFDGTDDFVGFGNPPQLSFGRNSFSVSYWTKDPVTGRDVSKMSDTATGNPGWYLMTADNSLQWGVGDGTTAWLKTGVSPTFSPNTWYHIVAVFNRTTNLFEAYVNSQQVTSTDISSFANSFDNSRQFDIGRRDIASASFHQGQLDDVRIYNYALTLDQIKTIYNGGAINFN